MFNKNGATLEGAASRGGEQIDDGLDRFVGMMVGRD
jgi:hypothetical protein